jgi:hypothetical protein
MSKLNVRRLRTSLLAALSLVVGVAFGAENLIPPLRWPTPLLRPGQLISHEVQVKEPQQYAVSLDLYITLPSRFSSFFDHESAEEAQQLSRILGASEKLASGAWQEAGVPGAFNVRVIDQSTGLALCDQAVHHPRTMATYMGRTARLVALQLPTGTYLIQVDALSVAPELAPLHTFVSFARAHHGK